MKRMSYRYGMLAFGLLLFSLAAEEIDIAPLLQIEHGVKRSMRRALGPFLEWNESEQSGRQLIAIRPFFSHYTDKARDYSAVDIFYPFYSYRRYGVRSRSIGLLGEGSNQNVYDSESAWQSYLLPLYAVGRTQEGKNYFGLFPIGGVVRDFFSYNRIRFYLFPLYMDSLKNGHIKSTHFLFPIFLKTDSKTIKKRRMFPLYGYKKEKGKWINHFLLWPLINFGWSLDPEVEGKAFGLFPLFARMHYQHKTREQYVSNTSFLWPFFKYVKTNNGFDLHAPWPFFIHGRGMDGPGSVRTWLWPFWGRDIKGEQRETFWFWPMYFDYYRPTLRGHREVKYFGIFWLNTVDYDHQTGKQERFMRLWPLLSSLRRRDGSRRIRFLDMFPIRDLEVIERNFAPIWTLYEYRSDPQRFRHDLLWGTWQFQKQNDGIVERHTLFPLFNYKQSADGKVRRTDWLTGLLGWANSDRGGLELKLLWFLRFKLREERPIDVPLPPEPKPE